ncbi:hypothetical protein [Moorena producens]|uniref:hypothetical protein n=1 Tax=Moorena producens TaxID=1155739 RepID=UPI001314BF8F|nr:hypothetical protein [Moorena producens]
MPLSMIHYPLTICSIYKAMQQRKKESPQGKQQCGRRLPTQPLPISDGIKTVKLDIL